MKLLTSLSLILALTGCVRGVRQETPAPVPSAIPSQGYPQIHVVKITNAIGSELQIIQDGEKLVNKVMQSDCFKTQVLSQTYTESLSLSPSGIYAWLSSRIVEVYVDMYTGSWAANHVYHTIGYENEPGVVHMNRYFVKTAYMVADNLIHEGEGHSQGFSHYGIKATSVPYRMNQIFEACAGEMAGKYEK